VLGEIEIGKHAWVCADVFVMPDVKIGEGTVIGVRSTVLTDIPPWKIAVGTPCRVIKDRSVN
jgi:putative colanic acid biosynthesis acetyltransferase WcaF